MISTRKLSAAALFLSCFLWGNLLYSSEISLSGLGSKPDTPNQPDGVAAGVQGESEGLKTEPLAGVCDSVLHIIGQSRGQILVYQKKIDSLEKFLRQLEKSVSAPVPAPAPASPKQIGSQDTSKDTSATATSAVEPKLDTVLVGVTQSQNGSAVVETSLIKVADTVKRVEVGQRGEKRSSAVDPDEKYRKAISLHASRSCREAIDTLNFLIKNFSEHRLIANFHYWIGECEFQLGNFNGAIVAFRQVFLHPGSFKEDDAHFMIAQSYARMGMVDNARAEFQALFFRHPQSEFIQRARRIYEGL